ncbi:MAG: hypothetical protein JW910_02680 [Anaerolineae bacterium]|nr:hypothetical protein [Anaerolineae bacterium]
MTEHDLWPDADDLDEPGDDLTAEQADAEETPTEEASDFDPYLTPPLGRLPAELQEVVQRIRDEQGEPKAPPEPVSYEEAFPHAAALDDDSVVTEDSESDDLPGDLVDEEEVPEPEPGDEFSIPAIEEVPSPAEVIDSAGEEAPTLEPVPARPLAFSFSLIAALPVVVTSNFLRYGLAGVRRYGPGDDDAPSSAPLAAITPDVIWQRAGGERLLTMSGVVFERLAAEESGAEAVAWIGRSARYGLEMAWVWDFYRVVTRVQVRVRGGAKPTAEQVRLAEVLAALGAGDALRLVVVLPTGDLDQVIPLDAEFVAARDLAAAQAERDEMQ